MQSGLNLDNLLVLSWGGLDTKPTMVGTMNGDDRPRRRRRREEEERVEVPIIGEDADADVRSRTSLKRERVNNENALKELVNELIDLNEGTYSSLEVPELVVDALLDARKIKSHGARERHLRLIRARLRDMDWVSLRRRIDLRKMGIQVEAPNQETTDWSEQLLIQGDPGLARFVEEYPHADRKRLRTLVRNVTAASPQRRGKARLALEQAVTHILSASPDDEQS